MISIVVVLFLLFGATLVMQQRSIQRIESILGSKASLPGFQSPVLSQQSGEVGSGAANSQDMVSYVNKTEESQKQNISFVSGKVLSNSGGKLTIEGDLVDWHKIKEMAAAGQFSGDSPAKKPAPSFKKTFEVTIDNQTQFSANNLVDIKAGDTIMVTAKELVYETDKLTATLIISPYQSSLPFEIQP